MKKISNKTIDVIKNYYLSNRNSSQITIDNFDEMMDIISSKISGLVTEIEDRHNESKEIRELLKTLDEAFDELNENENIDFNDLNSHIKN